MKSIGELLLFHCMGLYGQWLGYCKGWPFLVAFWFFVTALIWLRESQRWSQLLQTSVQGSLFSPLYPKFPELGIIKLMTDSGTGRMRQFRVWKIAKKLRMV
jgi:hypothetical protein